MWWPIYIINSVDNTKLPCYTLLPMQYQIFFQNCTPFINAVVCLALKNGKNKDNNDKVLIKPFLYNFNNKFCMSQKISWHSSLNFESWECFCFSQGYKWCDLPSSRDNNRWNGVCCGCGKGSFPSLGRAVYPVTPTGHVQPSASGEKAHGRKQYW